MDRVNLKHLLKLFGLAVACAAATLAVMLVLPHDRYILWQSENTEAYARLGWAYERIHDDQTPVDIAFIGTSHTMNGIDAGGIAREIAASGVRNANGKCLTATNLAIPAYGRNMHWLVTRELLRARPVKLLVIEVFENETRKAHPVFSHVADEADILGAPLLINLNYMHDIVRLPFRQVTLAAETLAPEEFGLKRKWSPDDYDGSTINNTRVVSARGVALTPPRDTVLPLEELKKVAEEHARSKNTHMLGARFADLEYAYPMHYLNGMLDLAKQRGVKVVFMYLPGYGLPDAPYDMKPYQGHGDMISANPVLRHTDYWFDADHLNATGAQAFSHAIAPQIAQQVPGTISAPSAPCGEHDLGYPERSTLKPFVKP